MSEQKYTPGPWTWFVGDKIDKSHPHIKNFVGADGQGFALTVGLKLATDEANAHLIAAAPELCEALRALVKATEDNDRPGDYGVCSHADVMVAARVAIAKAEGQS